MARPRGRIPREDRIIRKKEAETLMAHPLMVEFFERAEQRIFTEWQRAETPEDRERLWLTKMALQGFDEFVQSVIIDGKMAEQDLKLQGKIPVD